MTHQETQKTSPPPGDDPGELAVDLAALAALEDILHISARLALDLFARRDTMTVEAKSADQWVSEADLAIERVLRRELGHKFGDIAVLGEELGGSDGRNGWVLDPIDGTSNFLRGLPFWGVSVALMRAGQPILGGIAIPTLGICATAAKGRGLRLNGQAIPRPAPASVARTVAIGENGYWNGDEREEEADRLRQAGYDVVRYRSACVALALCALGHLDGYSEFGLKIWDIAAGWLLCTEAGLAVVTDSLGEHRVTIHAIREDNQG